MGYWDRRRHKLHEWDVLVREREELDRLIAAQERRRRALADGLRKRTNEIVDRNGRMQLTQGSA